LAEAQRRGDAPEPHVHQPSNPKLKIKNFPTPAKLLDFTEGLRYLFQLNDQPTKE